MHPKSWTDFGVHDFLDEDIAYILSLGSYEVCKNTFCPALVSAGFYCVNENPAIVAGFKRGYIKAKDIEAIVLGDIREMAQRIVLDEKTIREDFIRHNAELVDKAVKTAKKELQAKRKRTEELSRLMQVAYEDRLKGKMPEDICLNFIQRYSEEQKRLEIEIAELEAKLTETANTIQSADEFIRNIKKYLEAPELTREMCYELIDRVVVGGLPKVTGKEREIDIVYKVDIASVLRHKLNNSNQ